MLKIEYNLLYSAFWGKPQILKPFIHVLTSADKKPEHRNNMPSISISSNFIRGLWIWRGIPISPKSVNQNNLIVWELSAICRIGPSLTLYLHFHYESLNEPLHLRRRSYLHEQIDLSHTLIRPIWVG